MTIKISNKKFRRTFSILSILSILILGGICLLQISSMTKTMHNIALAQKMINNLLEENEEIQIAIMSSDPAISMESLAKDFEFEKIVKVQYLNIPESIVAAK